MLYSQLSGRKTLSSLLVAIIDSIPLLPLQRGEGGGGGVSRKEGRLWYWERSPLTNISGSGFYATPEVALSGNSQLTAERIPQ